MTGGGSGGGSGGGAGGDRRTASTGAQRDVSRTAGRAGPLNARTPGQQGSPAGSWSGHAELEELPAQPVVPRGSPRLGRTGTLTVAVMIGLLAAGFGVLGGRPSSTPEPTRAAAATALAGVPSPILGPESPRVSPWIACAAPPAEVPTVLLEVGGRATPGTVEVTYLGIAPTPPAGGPATRQPTGPPRIDVPSDVITEIWVDGAACANAWTVDLVQGDVLEAVTNPGLNPAYAAQNRFEVFIAPYGGQDVVLRAVLLFPTFIALVTWPIHVAPVHRPTGVLRTNEVQVQAVEGCDVVMTLGNGWEDRGAECGDDMNQGPSEAVTVERNGLLEFGLEGWDIMGSSVVCGRVSGHSFVPDPESGCTYEPDGSPTLVFAPSSKVGLWTLAIAVCASQTNVAAANRICGTWYANVEVR